MDVSTAIGGLIALAVIGFIAWKMYNRSSGGGSGGSRGGRGGASNRK